MENTKQTNLEWINEEIEQLTNNENLGPKLPSMKFEENIVVEIEVDFSKQFQKYTNVNSQGYPVNKAIIPIKHNNISKLWWLNIKNPIYKDIIRGGKDHVTKFKVLQTGKNQDTKYVLVK